MSDETRERLARIDASLAKQLRRSMERNALMAGALHMLRDDSRTPPWVSGEIWKILIGFGCDEGRAPNGSGQ
jgi:hypothetical protein